MVSTLKRAVQKVAASEMSQDLGKCLGQILGCCRRRPGPGGKSHFEFLFGMKPRFSFEAPYYRPIAANGELIRGLEIALAKSLKASRIVPYIPSKWSNKFDVGDTVLVRRGRRKPGSKILSPARDPLLSRPRITRGTHFVQTIAEISDVSYTLAG